MSTSFELHADIREETGKGAVRKLRLKNIIPAVIYGGNEEPKNLTLDHNKLQKAFSNEAFFSHILTINIKNAKEKAVVKAVHRHPYKPKILHVDFQRISAHEKITMQIPLHFKGEDVAPGAKQKGGNISHHISTVEVHCLPDNLPEFIEVDVSNLDLDEAIHLSNLKLPKGVELTDLAHGNDLPVVSTHMPRAPQIEEPTEEVALSEVPVGSEASAEENKEETGKE